MTSNNNSTSTSPPPWSSSTTNTRPSPGIGFNAESSVLLTTSKYFTELNDFDVVCGRGSGANDRSGNIHFRILVQSRKDEYVAVHQRDYESKTLIASEIVAAVRDCGGRFLKKVPEGQLQAERAWAERNTGREKNKEIFSGTTAKPDNVSVSLQVDDGTEVFELADEPTVLEKAKQALRQNRTECEAKRGAVGNQKNTNQVSRDSQHATSPTAVVAAARPNQMGIPTSSSHKKFGSNKPCKVTSYSASTSFGSESVETVPRDNTTTGSRKPPPFNKGGEEFLSLVPPPNPTTNSTPQEWHAFQEYWSGPHVHRRKVLEQQRLKQEQTMMGDAILKYQQQKEQLLQQQKAMHRQHLQMQMGQGQQLGGSTHLKDEQSSSTRQQQPQPPTGQGSLSEEYEQLYIKRMYEQNVGEHFHQQQSMAQDQQRASNPNKPRLRSRGSLTIQDLAAQDPIARRVDHNNQASQNNQQIPFQQLLQRQPHMNDIMQEQMMTHELDHSDPNRHEMRSFGDSLTIQDLAAIDPIARKKSRDLTKRRSRTDYMTESCAVDSLDFPDEEVSASTRRFEGIGSGTHDPMSIAGPGGGGGNEAQDTELSEFATSVVHMHMLRRRSTDSISQHRPQAQNSAEFSLSAGDTSMTIEPTRLSSFTEDGGMNLSDAEMARVIVSALNDSSLSHVRSPGDVATSGMAHTICETLQSNGSTASEVYLAARTVADKFSLSIKFDASDLTDEGVKKKPSSILKRMGAAGRSSKKTLRKNTSFGMADDEDSPMKDSINMEEQDSMSPKPSTSHSSREGSSSSRSRCSVAMSSSSSSKRFSLDDMSLLSMSIGEISDFGRPIPGPCGPIPELSIDSSSVVDRGAVDNSSTLPHEGTRSNVNFLPQDVIMGRRLSMNDSTISGFLDSQHTSMGLSFSGDLMGQSWKSKENKTTDS